MRQDRSREGESEDSRPTATLALDPEGERRGEDDIGVRSYDRGEKQGDKWKVASQAWGRLS